MKATAAAIFNLQQPRNYAIVLFNSFASNIISLVQHVLLASHSNHFICPCEPEVFAWNSIKIGADLVERSLKTWGTVCSWLSQGGFGIQTYTKTNIQNVIWRNLEGLMQNEVWFSILAAELLTSQSEIKCGNLLFVVISVIYCIQQSQYLSIPRISWSKWPEQHGGTGSKFGRRLWKDTLQRRTTKHADEDKNMGNKGGTVPKWERVTWYLICWTFTL